MNISIIGASLEGLVLAAAFANTGNDVLICDPWAEAPAPLPAQVEQVGEAGLARLLSEGFSNQRLQWRDDVVSCLSAQNSAPLPAQIVLVAGRRLDTESVIAVAKTAMAASATGAGRGGASRT